MNTPAISRGVALREVRRIPEEPATRGRSDDAGRRRTRPISILKRFALVALALLCGCAAPVGVERISSRAAQRDLTQSILSTSKLSEKSRILLRRLNMEALWKDDPAEVLAQAPLPKVARPMNEYDAELRAGVMDSVAELSFALCEQSGDRRYYLAAALYAWLYLFP